MENNLKKFKFYFKAYVIAYFNILYPQKFFFTLLYVYFLDNKKLFLDIISLCDVLNNIF